MAILEKDPVIIGGSSVGDASHEDTTKPPTLANVKAELLVIEDREGNLANNRNSDSAHNFKVTAPTTTASAGFAFFVQFGTQYVNAKGDPVAPHVTLESGNLGPSTYISSVTATGYSVFLPPVSVSGPPLRLRVSVKQPT